MCIENSDCNCGCGDRCWFPLNSRVQTQEDRSVFIKAPTGWVYIFTEAKTGKIKVATGGTTVSCDCTGTGGCMPFVASGSAGSTAGCAGNCTACTQKQSAKMAQGDDVSVENGGFVNMAGGVDFATLPDLPAAFGAMFEVKEIKQGFKAFLDRVYGGLPWPEMIIGDNYITAPEGFRMAPVNIYGRVAMVPVPTIALRTMIAGGDGSKTSCSCTQGTCSLKQQSIPFVGSASWCEGSCSGTCTLSNAVVVGNGIDDIRYVAHSFRY